MSVVAFYTNGRYQAGNTISATALATYIGIVQNKKVLLISTALNDSTIKDALWPPQTRKRRTIWTN